MTEWKEFETFLLDVLEEVRLRDRDYFRDFPVILPDDPFLSVGSNVSEFLLASETSLLDAAYRAEKVIRRAGINVVRRPELTPLGRVLLASALDAISVSKQQISFPMDLDTHMSIDETLAVCYDLRQSPSGIRYWIRHKGRRSLILVTALGIPLRTWLSFLGDQSHNYRIVLVETSTCDLVLGGLRSADSLAIQGREIADVVSKEVDSASTILGWSNGGRLALHVASELHALIDKVILLSPTLLGIKTIESNPCAFQKQLQRVFSRVMQSKSHSDHFSKFLMQAAAAPDFRTLQLSHKDREQLLLRLPRQSTAADFLAPVSSGDSLINYATRTMADEAFPIETSLDAIRKPILLISGDQDHIVNTEHTRGALNASGKPYLDVNVMGAGHYLHELQYKYFRHIIDSHCFPGPLTLKTCARASTRHS